MNLVPRSWRVAARSGVFGIEDGEGPEEALYHPLLDGLRRAASQRLAHLQVLPMERCTPNEVTLALVEPDRRTCQGEGEDRDGLAVRAIAKLVTVEGIARLQPQGVAGAEAHRRHPVNGAGIQDQLPQVHCL